MTAPEGVPSHPPVVPPRPGRRVVLKYLDGAGPKGGRLAIRAVVRPKVGRWRLFEWSYLGRTRLVCRACRAHVKPENQLRHLATELRRHGSETALEAVLRLKKEIRRGDRHLRGRRYEHEVGKSRDWPDPADQAQER